MRREFAALQEALADADQRIGRFRLIRELGAGGQGRVWLARDGGLENRLVALKAIPLARIGGVTAALRFRRELRIAAELQVPGICPILDAGEDDAVAWIAMRYVAGPTLAAWIHSRPDLGERGESDERLRLVEEIARTVDRVHACGVVHRDLKPAVWCTFRTSSCCASL